MTITDREDWGEWALASIEAVRSDPWLARWREPMLMVQGIFGGGLSDPASPTRTELGVRHECLPLRAVRLFDSTESETDREDLGDWVLAPIRPVRSDPEAGASARADVEDAGQL